jgi:hypothetical protein
MLVGLLEKTYLQPKFKPRKGWYRMTKFNPNEHLIKLSGKDYLMVAWRIVWFREEHPKGGIITELTSSTPVVMYAKVIDADGTVLGTGYGTPKTQGAAAKRPFEGAETAAIGRALAIAGYGTQFTGEDEGEHLADAPVEMQATQPKDRMWSEAQKKELVDNGLADHPKQAINILNLSVLPENTKLGVVWATYYRDGKDEGLTTEDAAEVANKKYVDAQEQK